MKRVGSILPRPFPWCRRACSRSFTGLMPSSITSRSISANGFNDLNRLFMTRYALKSCQGMKDLLHIIVLFEFVDQPQDLGRLILGQFDRQDADVLVLGGQRRNAALFESLLQLAKIIEGAANHQLRIAPFPVC